MHHNIIHTIWFCCRLVAVLRRFLPSFLELDFTFGRSLIAVLGCTSDGAEICVDGVVVGGAADVIGWCCWPVGGVLNDDIAAAPVTVCVVADDCIVVNKNALLSATFAPVRLQPKRLQLKSRGGMFIMVKAWLRFAVVGIRSSNWFTCLKQD